MTATTDSTNPVVATDPAAAAVVADAITERLTALGVTSDIIAKIKDELGATSVEDLSGLTEDDLISAGMKKLPARNLIKSLKPEVAVATAPTAAEVTATHPAAGGYGAMTFDDVLPAVPDDGAWLDALRAGGILKIDQSTVISAVRAALGQRVGLFNIIDTLVTKMEEFADSNDEQVSPDFYRLRKTMTRKNYGDIFEAIDGLDGSFVTEKRKKQLLGKIDTYLWPAIISFNGQLKAWQESWMQGAANPAMMMNAIMAASGAGMPMAPGMMQPPDTGVLRDQADEVVNALNRVFAGTGKQIAVALAYEAKQIRDTLTNPSLPAMIGAANREQMLRQLGVAVSATIPRLEVNLTRFVLAITQAKDQPGGNTELQYYGSLFMLGSQIPWDQISGMNGGSNNGLTPIGGRPQSARRGTGRDDL